MASPAAQQSTPDAPLSARAADSNAPRRFCRRATLLCAVLITTCAAVAYSNSFSVPFVFDDHPWIVNNRAIRDLSQPGQIVWPTEARLYGGRPVLSLTLAVNYALGGLDVRGYHAVNFLIHVLAALALFGVVRRSLVQPPLVEPFGAAATPLALAIAVLWAVHPLGTESVTYIIQRAESLAGLFFLLTLYCVLRGATADANGSDFDESRKRERTKTRNGWWNVAAVICCWLGVGTKEWVAVAPLVVLVWDRALLAGSFRAALKKRAGLYAGLAASWILLSWQLWSTDFHNQTTGVGVRKFTPLTYLMTEPGVILHYLRQAFWPGDLAIDYNWPPSLSFAGAVVIGALIVGTLWALVKRPALGALGATFFLVLAPTSSFVPIADAAAERRMYVPLAAVIVLVVLGGYELLLRMKTSQRMMRTFGSLLVALATVALGFQTFARNADYRSELALWDDDVQKQPDSWRAHYNYGCQLSAVDRHSAAKQQYREALRIAPEYAPAHHNLAMELVADESYGDAVDHLRKAVAQDPDFAEAYVKLGLVYEKLGKTDDAIASYEKALSKRPADYDALNDLGQLLARRNRLDEGLAKLRRAIGLKPDAAQAHYNLAAALVRASQFDAAASEYEQTLKLAPDHVGAHADLSGILIRRGQYDAAIDACRRAVAAPLTPESRPLIAVAQSNWGSALELLGKPAEAVEHWRAAVQLGVVDPNVVTHLAWALATSPDPLVRDGASAVTLAQQAANLTGGKDPLVLATYAAARAETGDFPRAVQLAERALDLAEERKDAALVESLKGQLQLYQTGQPYHENPAR